MPRTSSASTIARTRASRALRARSRCGATTARGDETPALRATQRLVALARETGKRIHVLHISTKEEIEYLRDHKDVASCEATPHHLTLVAPECYERLGSRRPEKPPGGGAPRCGGGC